jgi:hypothetical protein
MAKNPVVPARMTASLDGEFVVFLIGMRVNKWWKVHRWFPVAMAMGPMLAELSKNPESGLLGFRTLIGGRGPTVVQYWRSTEQLMAYSRARESAHLPAWKRFNRAVGTNGDVGIWHETYVVGPGKAESIYANMPRIGLAAAGEHLPVERRGRYARERLGGGSSPEV